MRTAMKKIGVEEDFLGVVRFTHARDTFWPTSAKAKQEGQERNSRK